jgi:hypothetical protein
MTVAQNQQAGRLRSQDGPAPVGSMVIKYILEIDLKLEVSCTVHHAAPNQLLN